MNSKSARFVDAMSAVDDILTQMMTAREPLELTLQELSKLHHMQGMLE
jgi:hypothetical protein